MKSNTRKTRIGFTLIELLVVIAIMLILASIGVGGFGFVQDRQKKEKARVQMALLSKAIEEYKLDMGEYPPTTDKTGSLSGPNGTSTSSILFDYLYWDSDRDGTVGIADTDQKIYVPELDPVNNKQGWTTNIPPASATTKITDPWGNEYCYRSAYGSPAVNGTAPENTNTQNPDFDLWSMGKDGKSASNPAMSQEDNKDDLRNF